MKILLVEDNLKLAEDIKSFLEAEGFVTEGVSLLSEASEKIYVYNYDLVIVDIGLPDGSGLELIKQLKEKKSDSGILIISAKNSVEDKVEGLELGADDYITKPFHQAELIARVKSIFRRKNFGGNNCVEIDEIKIDISANTVEIAGTVLSLTKKEFELLLYFAYNPGKVLTKENIAEHLWGDHIDAADNFDFIYSHIKNLRKKIISAGGKDYIKSVYGLGYKFSV